MHIFNELTDDTMPLNTSVVSSYAYINLRKRRPHLTSNLKALARNFPARLQLGRRCLIRHSVPGPSDEVVRADLQCRLSDWNILVPLTLFSSVL